MCNRIRSDVVPLLKQRGSKMLSNNRSQQQKPPPLPLGLTEEEQKVTLRFQTITPRNPFPPSLYKEIQFGEDSTLWRAQCLRSDALPFPTHRVVGWVFLDIQTHPLTKQTRASADDNHLLRFGQTCEKRWLTFCFIEEGLLTQKTY